MRRNSIVFVAQLCSGIFLLHPVHADLIVGSNPPDTYNAPDPKSIGLVTNAYAATNNFPGFQAGMTRLEKSDEILSSGNRSRPHAQQSAATVSAASSVGSNSQTVIPTPGASDNIGTSQISVAWVNSPLNSPGTVSLVQISLTNDFRDVIASVNTDQPYATFNGLMPGTQYYVRVQAIDSSGNPSPFLPLPSVKTLDEKPASGASLIGTNDRGVSNGMHYYEIYWALPQGHTCVKNNVPVGPFPENVFLVAASEKGVVTTSQGTSGYSDNVCQANVAAPVGTGTTLLNFNFMNYLNCPVTGCNVGYVTDTGAANPSSLLLRF